MYPTSLLGYSLSRAIQYLVLILSIYRLSSTPLSSPVFSLFVYYVRIVYVLDPWVLYAYSTLCIYAPVYVVYLPTKIHIAYTSGICACISN